MQQNHIEVYDSKQQLLLKEPLSKNITFKISLDTTAVQCLSVVNVEPESWLWHYRFGLLIQEFESIELINEKMVSGLPSIHCPRKTCEGCVIGKQSRITLQSTKILSYIGYCIKSPF